MKDYWLRHNAAAWAMLLFVLVGRTFGQTPGTGAISGVVYDPAKRVIGNAVVLTVNVGTDVSRSVVTTAEGVFRVPLLLPGTYTVTIKAAGLQSKCRNRFR
ncbi:MAG: carboxypeptidase-like regulatory domain-containing protein [Terracidiphilus sp.]